MSKPKRHGVGIHAGIAVYNEFEQGVDTCRRDMDGLGDSYEATLASGMHITKSVG